MSDGLTEKYRQGKLDEDIAKLEAEMFGPPKETSENAEQEEQVLDDDSVISPDQSTNEDASLTDDPFNKVTTGEDTQPEESETVESLRRELKEVEHQRNRYKGKTDRTIFDLRSEVGRLNKISAQLKKSNLDLQAKLDDQEATLNDEQKDIFGEDGSKMIEDLQKEIKSLKRQVDSGPEQFEKAAESVEETNYKEFMDKLYEMVPELDAMNADPDFNEWLRQPDQYGIERLATLRSDQARYDYVRVAQFFNEYKSMSKTVEKVKKDFPDSSKAYTGPTGTQSGDSNKRVEAKGDGYLKQSEINQYERDVIAGKYKYDSAYPEAFEAKIFQASVDGKIIKDEPPTRSFKVR